MFMLSTPHGALGTVLKLAFEFLSEFELSTPHGALGTVFKEV